MKLSELINEWLYQNHFDKIKERSLIKYESAIRNNIIPYFGNAEIENLSPREVQNWINFLKTKKSAKTNNVLSPSSINTVAAIMKMAFNYAVDYEIIDRNPALRLKIQAPVYYGNVIKAFTKEEQIKLEKYIEKSKRNDYSCIILVLYTGIRLGELLALTWEDVDFENGTLKITKTAYSIKTEDGTWKYKITKPKTRSSVRDIPLSSFIVDKLKQMRRNRKSEKILCSEDGQDLSYIAVVRRFSRLLVRLKIRPLTFHSLRHTFATRALENNMDVKTLSEILGHSNVSTTLNIYVHSLMEHKRNQIKKIKRLI